MIVVNCSWCGANLNRFPKDFKIPRKEGFFCKEKCQAEWRKKFRAPKPRRRSPKRAFMYRLMKNTRKDEKSGCWLWEGAKLKPGSYGRMNYNGKPYALAHRVAYEIFIGPFDQSLDVLHDCDTPACINPHHLFLGTHQDNMADMLAKGRGQRGSRSGVAKLTEAKIQEIRQLAANGKFSHREIAKLFNIDKSAISRIANRKTWKHVE